MMSMDVDYAGDGFSENFMNIRSIDDGRCRGNGQSGLPVRRAGELELGTLHAFLVAIICAAYGITRAELTSTSRRKARVAHARQVAMYLAHVAGGVSLTGVGQLFGRDRTTAAHACRLIEDQRDDPALDLVLEVLGAALIAWCKQDWVVADPARGHSHA